MPFDRILIVEDEDSVRHVLQRFLTARGCDVDVAGSAEEGLGRIGEAPPAVVLLDIVLPGMSGLDMLGRIKQVSPDTEVVIMTSHASVETAVQAIRSGAYDFQQKPFEQVEDVWNTVKRALEKRSLSLSNRRLIVEEQSRNQELRSAVTRLSSLIDAGRAMAELHSLSEILDFFIGLVARELGVDHASLMLREEATGELRIRAGRGLDDVDPDTIRVRPGEGIAGRVAETGEPFLVTDARSDARVEKSPNPRLSDSFMCAPIVLSVAIKSREKVLGVINVTNRRSGEPFAEADLSYLAGLAGQLAVAVDRASQLEELKRAYVNLESAQEQLVLSERIKALGQMAAGVAHDFNNGLSVILARTQLAARVLEQAGDVREIRSHLELIREASLQSAETIKRIQDYTRIRKDTSLSNVDLNAVVRNAVEMTRPKWKGEAEAMGRTVTMEFALEARATVSGNAHELTQVVDNLIFNAVEAMPRGGTLTFRTFDAGEWVGLENGDTGEGMSEKTCTRLFEPFFTTKNNGHGLGTSIVYGIVERHGGTIEVDSREGEGTTFRIRMPRTSSPTRTDVEGRLTRHPERRIRVLLVDDDALVRECFEEALSSMGHDIAALPSADDALRAISDARFDVAITDLSMPGISGLELAGKLKEADPDLPVILLSGWAAQQDESEIRAAGIDRIVAKPCLIEDLLEAVHELTHVPTER